MLVMYTRGSQTFLDQGTPINTSFMRGTPYYIHIFHYQGPVIMLQGGTREIIPILVGTDNNINCTLRTPALSISIIIFDSVLFCLDSTIAPPPTLSHLRVLYVISWTSRPNSSLAACLKMCSRKPSEPRPSCLTSPGSPASPNLQDKGDLKFNQKF